MTVERRDGPTPAGGAYSVAVYLDDEGNETTPFRAARIEIVEYDENDQRIAETYGVAE